MVDKMHAPLDHPPVTQQPLGGVPNLQVSVSGEMVGLKRSVPLHRKEILTVKSDDVIRAKATKLS